MALLPKGWKRLIFALSALLLTVACIRNGVPKPPELRIAQLSAVDLSEGEDFARVVLVWMGQVEFTETFEAATDGLPGQLTLRMRPAKLMDGHTVHGFERRLGGTLIQNADRGPIQEIVLREDGRSTAVELTLHGQDLSRYRISVFENPHRIVIDAFVAEASQPQDWEADALGDLVEAMSETQGPADAEKGDFLVVLDPGHGGFEPGATGPRGIREKDVNLEIGLRVAQILQGVEGVEVVMTRTTDVFLPLKERTRIANALEADLFVSLHANASLNENARGIETYYLNTATDRAAARLAKRENTVAGGLGDYEDDNDLMGLLKDLSIGGQVEHSRSLALNVQREMVSALRTEYAPKSVRDRGVKTALFYVLVGSNMASILVETSFISHAQEEARLIDPNYQNELAQAIVRGILTYAQDAHRLPHLEMGPQ